MTPLGAIAIAMRLVPVIREAIRATRKASPGGRKITRAERDRILAAALGGVATELEGVLFGGLAPDD